MRLDFFAKGLSGTSSKHFRKCLVKIVYKLSNNSRGSVILGYFSGILSFIQKDICSAFWFLRRNGMQVPWDHLLAKQLSSCQA